MLVRRCATAVRLFAVTAVLLIGGFAAVPTPAHAAAAAPSAQLFVLPGTTHAGNRVLIGGLVPATGPQACPADDQAILTSTAALFPPDGFLPVDRTASGRFLIAYRVPSSTPPGDYAIGVRCGGGNVGVSASLRVA